MQTWKIYCKCCGNKIATRTRTGMLIVENTNANNVRQYDKVGWIDCRKCKTKAPLKMRKVKFK